MKYLTPVCDWGSSNFGFKPFNLCQQNLCWRFFALLTDMTRIDFYVYKIGKNTESIACKLAVKAWQNQLSMYIHTNSQQQTTNVDNLLWSFRDDSFVPHETINNYHPKTKIYIGNEQDLNQPMLMLVNLADKVPLFFSQFERVAEIITSNNKPLGRERYKFYKDRGYQLKTYNLDK